MLLAAETAKLAQKLPDRTAVSAEVCVARKEKHAMDLLSVVVSRGHQDCNRFVTILQAVNTGYAPIICMGYEEKRNVGFSPKTMYLDGML